MSPVCASVALAYQNVADPATFHVYALRFIRVRRQLIQCPSVLRQPQRLQIRERCCHRLVIYPRRTRTGFVLQSRVAMLVEPLDPVPNAVGVQLKFRRYVWRRLPRH